jgi:restriction system protein
MPITDKLDRINEDNLRDLTAFVLSMDTEIREMAQEAINNDIKNPLIWLIDCRDELGLRLAKEWEVEEVMGSRSVEELPYAITRAVSYEKARDRFGKMSINLEIPEPRESHIDVLAVTQGGIFVNSLPRNPTYRDMWPEPGEILAVMTGLETALKTPSHDLMLQAIVEPVDRTKEGELIRAIALPWLAIAREIERDPNFLYRFAKSHRKFEEFIAATYEMDGWDDVILTQRSGNGGIDVIATKYGLGSLRFLDQCKAYSPGRMVTHDDVRSMLGVLSSYPNASKGILTTTSKFQPGIFDSEPIKSFMPNRLELRAGEDLRSWITDLVSRQL